MYYLGRIIATIFLIYFYCSCDNFLPSNNAKISFECVEKDFGKLNFNGDGSCSFLFSNTGNTPLVIQYVKTSCGCTVADWPQKPIKPGMGGVLKISYDTSHLGVFYKTITVFYNGKGSPATLFIKGSVDGSAEISS